MQAIGPTNVRKFRSRFAPAKHADPEFVGFLLDRDVACREMPEIIKSKLPLALDTPTWLDDPTCDRPVRFMNAMDRQRCPVESLVFRRQDMFSLCPYRT